MVMIGRAAKQSLVTRDQTSAKRESGAVQA